MPPHRTNPEDPQAAQQGELQFDDQQQQQLPDRTQVVIVFVPERDWHGLARWTEADRDSRYEFSRDGTYTLAIPQFEYSTRQPLLALLLHERDANISIVAAANRGRYRAAVGLSQLELRDAALLPENSPCRNLQDLCDTMVRNHPRIRQFFNETHVTLGGLMSPSVSQAVSQQLQQTHPALLDRIARAFPDLRESFSRAPEGRRFVFQQQRDAALLAFRVVGLDANEHLKLREPPDLAHSFLDQLPPTRFNEDQVLRADAEVFPGMTAIPDTRIDRRTFTSGNRRLDLIFAHRERMEEITGADFIYYNATFGSFVLVQYKLLEKEGDREFYRVNDHMREQMAQMRASALLPNPLPDDEDPNAFRVGHEACFWKFASRQPNLETDQSLIPGHYLPLSFLQKCIQTGPRGGEYIEPTELPRALSNTDFAALVKDAWVGTTGQQTAALQQLITSILKNHRGLTIAVHHTGETGEPA